jgi:RNA polymerase sigma-70 factor (ECF subfamily)
MSSMTLPAPKPPVTCPPRLVSSAIQNSSEPSDVRTLIEEVQGGNNAAFAVIYQRFEPLISSVVHSRVTDRHQAEDLVSDTFTRALASIRDLRWRSDAEFVGWLVTIAKNLVTNHYTAARTRLVVPSPRAGVDLVDERSAEAAPETSVVGRNHLLALLAQLGPRQREVVVHRILLDRSVEETAAELGCHESVVKHALSKARRRLGALLHPREVAVA